MEEKYSEIREQYIDHFGYPPMWPEPSPLSYTSMIEYMLKAIDSNIPVHQMLRTEYKDKDKVY